VSEVLDPVDADLAVYLAQEDEREAEAELFEFEVNRIAGDAEVIGDVLYDIGAYLDKNQRIVRQPDGSTRKFGQEWTRDDVIDAEGDFNSEAPSAALFVAMFSSENAVAIKCLHALRERMQPGIESRAAKRVAA